MDEGPGADVTATPEPAARAAVVLPLDLLVDNPENPRSDFGPVAELAQDVRRHGIITPLIVRPLHGQFQLLAGHRRVRAARLAGLVHVPCVLRNDVTDDNAWEVLLAENVHRQNLNPIEEAKAFDNLLRRGLVQRDIAVRLGVTEGRVSRRLGLLLLDEETQQLIIQRAMSMAEAWEVVRDTKARKGPKPGNGGRSTKYDRHFNSKHELAAEAEHLCAEENQHPDVMRHLGPACGACWEMAIRMDEAATILNNQQVATSAS